MNAHGYTHTRPAGMWLVFCILIMAFDLYRSCMYKEYCCKTNPMKSYFAQGGEMYSVKASAVRKDGFHFTVHTLNVINKLNAVEEKRHHSFSL